MDILKSRVGNALTKFSNASRDILVNLRDEYLPKPAEKFQQDYNTLTFLNDGHSSSDDYDPCLENDKDFGILTIEDEKWPSCNSLDGERRNDREEIRRKLAMDSDTEDYISEKLSQHRANADSFDRLSGAGNLQICFMNEAAKDQDFSNPEDEGENKKEPLPMVHQQQPPVTATAAIKSNPVAAKALPATSPARVVKRQRPKFFFNRPRSWHPASKHDERPVGEEEPEDLQARHTRLQAEAREALSQAKDMARMQMEIERQKKKKSPIVDIVGLPFPDGKNLLTYHALVAMNLAQLQVIVNDLHSQIETLNEDLVKFLLERDDLHMEQDSMLVDIEDLTRYLGLKGTASSSSSKVSADISSEKKEPKVEPVRRSQSVHLKSKNLMWPLQLTLFNSGYSSKR